MTYFTRWTDAGVAKRAQAELEGTQIVITHMAVGDGGGAPVIPDPTMTELVNEVWRGDVLLVAMHPDSPNWVTVEATVPMDTGGWTIREVGLFDAEGDLVAVGNYPDTVKPVLDEGAGADLYLRMILAVETADTIELTIEPDVVMATKTYVDGHVANLERAIMEAELLAFFQANTMVMQ